MIQNEIKYIFDDHEVYYLDKAFLSRHGIQ